MIDKLIELGLSETEAKVYQAVLDNGSCFVAPIVHTTKKHRQIVYNALESLIKKNLIIVSQRRGKKFFSLSDPQKFLVDLEQKKIVARTLVRDIQKKLQKETEQVETFTGPESYQVGLTDFRMRAEEAGEYIVIGGQKSEWYEFMKDSFSEHVSELKCLKKKGIEIQILFFESERQSALKYIGPYLHDPYRLRITNKSPRLPHTCWLAGSHVYLLTPTNDPLVIHIQSQALAEEYRAYFQDLWKVGEKIAKS